MKGRDLISGVLLLDKPEGWTSNQALGRVKRLLNASKAGHTGTLDPFATGLLPICLGEATKFSADLLEADKTYVATARLGERTSTGDVEGEVIETRAVHVSRERLDAVVSRFRGAITQVPPMYSALKRDGTPLYELARRGVEVEREARNVTIHALDVLAFDNQTLVFRVTCSKGTYVRVLAQDIGEALGCGAHLTALRRERVETLDLAQTIDVVAFEAMTLNERHAALMPLDALLNTVPRVDLDAHLAARFAQGQRLRIDALTVGRVRVYEGPRLLGTALLDAGGRLQPQRLISREPI
ncbi:MAG TPA: tRNA pseudouridine(55) synthase TruB [Burkholderiaceae bacterium]|nr:tRNA pseudouridine(55) synthase TruB [Burkholderiaceae bacterium]